MPDKTAGFITAILSIALFTVLLSCASDNAPLQIENSLPQNELAYYNDSFDEIREDLWDRAGLLHKQEQIQNFKLADMRFERGKLVIRTKTGGFSKGGLGTKYSFRGDFDIQLDCRTHFLSSAPGMDQLLNILVVDTSGMLGRPDIIFINLRIGELMHQGWLESGAIINGRWNKGGSKLMENFDGTLRIVRKGNQFSTLYKNKGASAWRNLHTFSATDNDMLFGFQVRNFFNKRTSIQATQSISAEFDNFKINAAQKIIEEDI